jgi:hypothetical protein
MTLGACSTVMQIVEVTQVVPVTQVVQITQVVPVTQVVQVTKIVEVRRLVDVTQAVTVTPTGGQSFVFTVEANRDWQRAGVILPAGSQLTLSVSPGTWNFNLRGGEAYLVGPEGYPGEYHTSLEGQCWPAPLPEAKKGALVARIGSGVPFVVGRALERSVGAGGTLAFRINDDCMGDNEGSLTVQIEIRP